MNIKKLELFFFRISENQLNKHNRIEKKKITEHSYEI